MTRLNNLAPRTTMASPHRVRRAAHGRTREARIRRSFDGVVASYIRELAANGDHASGKSGRELQRTSNRVTRAHIGVEPLAAIALAHCDSE